MLGRFSRAHLRRMRNENSPGMTNVRVRKVMGLGRLVGALRRDVFVRGGEVNVDGNIIPDREARHTWEHRGTSYLHITHSSWFST